MSRTTRTSLAIIAILGLSACARMQPGLGFDDVRQSIADRTGNRIHWDSGSPQDHEAHAAIDSLLERELKPDAAVQIALLNNRSLQAVYEELNIAQADLVQAGLLKNPIFGGEVRWDTGGGGTAVVLDVSQNFLSLFTLPLRRGRATAVFEAAKLRVTSAVLDLAGETREAYIDLVAAEQLRELRATILESMSASADLAHRLYDAGNIPGLDVSNERAAAEAARFDLAAAEADIVQRREVLNERMGLWGDLTAWTTPTRLPPVPSDNPAADDIESRAVEANLGLAADRRAIEIAARDLRIAKPFALLGETDVGIAAERELDGGWSVGPSVSVPIPLFDQGQASVGKARAELRQAAQRYYAAAVTLRARARAAHASMQSARDRADYTAQVLLPLREQIVHETLLQYNAMQIGGFQLLQARRDQAEGGARYVESLRDYWLARARLEQILAGGDAAIESGPMRRSSSTQPSSSPGSANGGH